MLNELHIREALRDCYTSYRAKCVNIVDLGLVHRITLVPDSEAPGANIPGVPRRQRLTLNLLTDIPDSDLLAQLSALIANRLAGLPQLSGSEIIFTPGWAPSMISPAGRALLQLDFPILNNR